MKQSLKILIIVMSIVALSTACGLLGKDEISYKDIVEANDGHALLEKYDNVHYVMKYSNTETSQTCVLSKNDNGEVLYFSTIGSESIYCNQVYYKNEPGTTKQYTVGWFMPGYYDELLSLNVKAFLVDDSDGSEIVEQKVDGKTTVVTTKVITNGQEVYYEYIVDSKTFEIQGFSAYAMKDEEKELYAESTIKYNVQYEEPEYVKRLEEYPIMRTLTVTIDPGEKSEKVYTEKLPKNAVLKGFLDEGYALYTDKEGTNAYRTEARDDNFEYGDLTLYCIKK